MKLKKIYLTILLSWICAGFCHAQRGDSSTIKVIAFQSKFKSYYNNGFIEDFGQDKKIAFYKDLILYKVPTIHFEPKHGYINFDGTKDGDTIEIQDTVPSKIERITYEYFIYRNGSNTGLSYGDLNLKGNIFFTDTLLMHSNNDHKNQESNGIDLGPPKQTKKLSSKIRLEKFYDLDTSKGMPDSVFRYYDDGLIGINFSLSPKLDREKKSKLVKSLFVIKYQNEKQQRIYPYKLEILAEFSVFTKSCTKREIEIFMSYFKKFELDYGSSP